MEDNVIDLPTQTDEPTFAQKMEATMQRINDLYAPLTK